MEGCITEFDSDLNGIVVADTPKGPLRVAIPGALIGEKKEDCVMFEDALYAMKGARSAGLGVVGVTDETNLLDREAIHAVCDVVIDSFDELA